MLFSQVKNTNAFTRMLEKLEIPHTKKYADSIFESHPKRKSFLGLTEMFSLYNIKTNCYQFQDTSLDELPFPFIAVLAGELFVVESNEGKTIKVDFEGRNEYIRKSSFYSGWNGQALIIEDINDAHEPNYEKRRRNLLIDRLVLLAFFIALAYLVFFAINDNPLFSYSSYSYLLIDTLGLYFSFLSMNAIDNTIKHKLCSIFTKSNCDKVHHSKASMLLGRYSLGEIGFVYFLSNLTIQLFLPLFSCFLVYINSIAVLFSLWSVGYQKIVVKAWCPVCLFVQLIVIIKVILLIIFDDFVFQHFTIVNLFIVPSIFMVEFYLITSIFKLHVLSLRNKENEQSLKAIKGNRQLFNTLLKQNQHYDTSNCSNIVFGDVNSAVELTVLVNPFCKPCNTFHKKLEKLLSTDLLTKCKIKFVFMAYSVEKEKVIYSLIGFYNNNTLHDSLSFINNWFHKGDVAQMNYLFEIYCFDLNVKNEMDIQQKWLMECKLFSAPTLLFNGYLFPDEYDISDLSYILT